MGEVLETMTVDIFTKVPVPRFEEVPKIVFETQERLVKIPLALSIDRRVDVPEVMEVETLTQVAVHETQFIDKHIPRIQVQPVEKTVEIPVHLMREVVQEVPEIQLVEAIVQEFCPSVQEVKKQVPRSRSNSPAPPLL